MVLKRNLGLDARTRMMDNGKFAVCLLDLDVCGGGLDAQGVVVRRINDHGGSWVSDFREQFLGSQ